MQSVFVIITKLIASNNYFCKEGFCNNFGRDDNLALDSPLKFSGYGLTGKGCE